MNHCNQQAKELIEAMDNVASDLEQERHWDLGDVWGLQDDHGWSFDRALAEAERLYGVVAVGGCLYPTGS